MTIQTTRWGQIQAEPAQVWAFPNGLIGLPQLTQVALLPHDAGGRFSWLQCCENPELALCVVDPERVGLVAPHPGDRPHPTPGLAVRLVVRALAGPDGQRQLTANLQAPVILDHTCQCGWQRVLSDKRWSLRALLDVGALQGFATPLAASA